MSNPLPNDVTPEFSSTANALRRLVDLVSHRSGSALSLMEAAGVTLPQVLLLSSVECAGTASISSLAEVSPGSAAAVSQMVDRLVRQNLLVRSEDAIDRRRKIVSLSTAGTELLRQLETARTTEYAVGLSKLSPDLVIALDGLLKRILANLNDGGSR